MTQVHLTRHERSELINAVQPWQDFGAPWYVDHYLIPVVEEIVAHRLREATESSEPQQ